MRPRISTVLLAGLWLSATEAVGAQELTVGMFLTIRTYASASVPPEDRLGARAVAGGILRAAGLDVQWRSCDVAHGDIANDCAHAVGPADLAVRFVRLPSPGAHSLPVALGSSLVEATGPGVLATVYVDRVGWLAAACGVDVATLLGRTMAHEIGHLLLESSRHTWTGLMRASWSCEALRRDSEATWQFGPPEASAIRDSVRRRTLQVRDERRSD